MYEDICLECKECGNQFCVTAAEQERRVKHGLPPVIIDCCISCYMVQREKRRPAKKTVEVMCARCGKRMCVSSTADSPVFCCECVRRIMSVD